MISIQRKFTSKSSLEGPPFQLLIEGKSKKRLRRSYVIMLLVWIYYVILRSKIDDPLYFIDSVIFLVVYIPALILLLEDQMIISGDHGSWIVSKTKNILNLSIVTNQVSSSDINIEVRVVSHVRKNISLIVLMLQSQTFSIKSPNQSVRDFIDDCEVANLKIHIRKRGKTELRDDKTNY
ncbi:MAG: hypothetical protein ACW99A_06440 [Candidatus Kariarchaeaceae archaeon]|jgi:hypothetical protein